MIKSIYKIPVEKHLICDKCNTEMVPDGVVLQSNPPQYPFTCPNCGEKMIMNEYYPHIVYEDKHALSDIFQTNIL